MSKSNDTPCSVVQHVPGTQRVVVDFGSGVVEDVPRASLQTMDERVQKLAALDLELNQVTVTLTLT